MRICLALMVTGLILTQSRMGNAAFFSALMLAGIAGLIIFRRSSRSVILLFSSLIIIDTLLMGAFFGIDKLQQRIEQADMSTDARVYGNKLALDFLTNTIWSPRDDVDTQTGKTPAKASTATAREASSNEKIDQGRMASAPEAGQKVTRSDTDHQGADVKQTLPPFALPASSIVLGTGAGTYYTFFPLYRDENVHLQNVHAHNDFFEFGLEFGIVGSLFLIAIVGLTMVAAIRAQTRRRYRLMQAMGFAGMMAIFSLMIHSVTDFNLQIYANPVTYVAILALPFIAITTNHQEVSSSRTR